MARRPKLIRNLRAALATDTLQGTLTFVLTVMCFLDERRHWTSAELSELYILIDKIPHLESEDLAFQVGNAKKKIRKLLRKVRAHS